MSVFGPITEFLSEQWQVSQDGTTETRVHLGRSRNGYHFGIEVAPAGEARSFTWSDPCITEADARVRAGAGLLETEA